MITKQDLSNALNIIAYVRSNYTDDVVNAVAEAFAEERRVGSISASTLMICCDERHQAKVRALEHRLEAVRDVCLWEIQNGGLLDPHHVLGAMDGPFVTDGPE